MKKRAWCFTLNNWTDKDLTALEIFGKHESTTYLIYGKEVGESGTKHLQGYFYKKNPVTLRGLKKGIFEKAHLEDAKGSPSQNKEYCSKQGNFIEFGEMPRQGKRTDIIAGVTAIKNGETTADMLALTDPVLYNKCWKTLSKAEDVLLRSKFRTEMTQCIWYYGATGVGKSHRAFSGFSPTTHYVANEDNGWWDGYTQQSTVIINDFRGHIKYNDFLQLVDKWPYCVKRRHREPMPFTSSLVIVTSSLPPWSVYTNRAKEDCIQQLLRRVSIVKLFQDGTEVREVILTPEQITEEMKFNFY